MWFAVRVWYVFVCLCGRWHCFGTRAEETRKRKSCRKMSTTIIIIICHNFAWPLLRGREREWEDNIHTLEAKANASDRKMVTISKPCYFLLIFIAMVFLLFFSFTMAKTEILVWKISSNKFPLLFLRYNCNESNAKEANRGKQCRRMERIRLG